MSFIAITYGYNQFSIFNTNVSTLPLIDNIISTCLEETNLCLDTRLKSLTKELEDFNTEEENLKKLIKKLEGDKQKEEDKISTEAQKSNEQKDTGKKQGSKNTPKVNNAKAIIQPDLNSSSIHAILDEIKSNDNKLQQITANKEKMVMKKKMLVEYKEKYDGYLHKKKEIKIDLVDQNGDRVNIYTRGDAYANSYLVDRQCYELYKSYYSKKILEYFRIFF
jgi:hypothetical protein